eukprot:gb/GECH01011499.1/.p1 GENE.gb/GECH01011499.1/~~gb/GECH01011499.1/.p1  ORF type:complete len:251 (+),score=63.90 gb/GECH01011499.1/:1-753(+)
MSHQQTDSSKFFDEKAKNWDKEKIRVSIASTGGKTMLDAYPDWNGTERILDFGCGTGVVSFILAPKAGQVVGLDTSEGMIQTLRDKAEKQGMLDKVSGVVEDITPSEWEPSSDAVQPGSYDIVVSSLTLHHIHDPALIVKRLANMLKPNGTMMIMDIEKTKHSGDFHPAHIAHQAGVHHHGGFTRSAMKSMYEDAGLKNVGFHTFQHERPVFKGNNDSHNHDDSHSHDNDDGGQQEMKTFDFIVTCGQKE